MNELNEIIEQSLQRPTLEDALTYCAKYQLDKIVELVKADPEADYETDFDFLFYQILQRYDHD